ncbi:hypothetical protein Alsa3_CDS0180 [Staphylococcus phage Alsa_3]|nr:hypothetical protein Alsa3_CDS0180 [Staphylococcus phage Alsa_3]WNM51305.1 hypothetical protein Alsa4_CDS0175 [Staphylococcus phage Alsa_4]
MNFSKDFTDINILFSEVQEYFNNKIDKSLNVDNGNMVLLDTRLDFHEMEYTLIFSNKISRPNYLLIYITLYPLDNSLGLGHEIMVDKEIVSDVSSINVRTDYDIVKYIKEQVFITLEQLNGKTNFDLKWN